MRVELSPKTNSTPPSCWLAKPRQRSPMSLQSLPGAQSILICPGFIFMGVERSSGVFHTLSRPGFCAVTARTEPAPPRNPATRMPSRLAFDQTWPRVNCPQSQGGFANSVGSLMASPIIIVFEVPSAMFRCFVSLLTLKIPRPLRCEQKYDSSPMHIA